MSKKLIALVLYLYIANAQAAFQTGNSLLTHCTDTVKIACYGYLMAAADTYNAWHGWGELKARMCVPSAVSGEQLRLIVVKHLEVRPEALHYNAGGLVLNALMEAFPCK